MQTLVCPACSHPAASTDSVCTRCGLALPGRGAARTGIPTWAWITGGLVLGCGGIVVIGLVATLVVPNVIEKLGQAKETKARMDIAEIERLAAEFAAHHDGRYAASLEELARPDEHGNRYLKPRALLDPWKHAYVYRAPEAGEVSATVFSTGPDGIADTDDDVRSDDAFAAEDETDADARMQADIEELTNALNEFAIRNNASYPAALAILWMPDASGARYIDRDTAPRDAWGNEYEYRLPGAEDEDPLVFSKGPDGVGDTADDVYAEDAEHEDDSEPVDEEEPVDDGSPR